jgi:biotin carboxylase
MNHRVLLLGTSFSAAPLAHFLKTAGMRVSVCGKFPTDPCAAWADDYYSLDYSDADALLQLVKDNRFSAIAPSCNDYSYLSAAHTAYQLGYPGFDDPETTAILHDKSRFRAFALTHGIPVPKTWDISSNSPTAFSRDFPLLVKPVDSFSGRGVGKITCAEQLQPAIAEARAQSRSNNVVVEQYIEGTLHSHSAFLRSRDIDQDFFVDEFCTVYPYQVNCSNSPSHLSDRLRDRVRDCIRDLAGLLRLCDGLLHTQFIVRGNDIYLIECMRRCPGDLYYHLISFSTSMPYVANYLRPFLGEAIAFPSSIIDIPWARHTISLAEDTIVHGFAHTIPSPEVRYFPLRESGSLIRQAPFDKVAILFARFEEVESMFCLTPRLHDLITVYTAESLAFHGQSILR